MPQVSSLDSVWIYTKTEVEFGEVMVATLEWKEATPANHTWCTKPGIYDAELDAYRYSIELQYVDAYIDIYLPWDTARSTWQDTDIHTYWRPSGSANPYELAPFEGCVVFFGSIVSLERDTWASIKTSF